MWSVCEGVGMYVGNGSEVDGSRERKKEVQREDVEYRTPRYWVFLALPPVTGGAFLAWTGLPLFASAKLNELNSKRRVWANHVLLGRTFLDELSPFCGELTYGTYYCWVCRHEPIY